MYLVFREFTLIIIYLLFIYFLFWLFVCLFFHLFINSFLASPMWKPVIYRQLIRDYNFLVDSYVCHIPPNLQLKTRGKLIR